MIALLYMLALINIGTATLPQALVVVVAKAFVAIDEEVGLSPEPVLEVVVAICTGVFIGVTLGFLGDALRRRWRRTRRRRRRARDRQSQPFGHAG